MKNKMNITIYFVLKLVIFWTQENLKKKTYHYTKDRNIKRKKKKEKKTELLLQWCTNISSHILTLIVFLILLKI